MQLTHVCLTLAWSLAFAGPSSADDQISGPFTRENLSIFLVKAGKRKSARKQYLTLKDAIDQRKVVVYETKEVNELAIENVSDEEVFIQSGDIVKGGQQDRVMTNDFILPRRSGRLAVAAFCVEEGRWTRRGSEPDSRFNSSNDLAATKQLKMAVSVNNNQAEVWSKVAAAQAGLATATAQTVTVQASTSSMQLTLTSKPVENAVKGYIKALRQLPAGSNVVGLVFAVNGEINSADIYSSPELFAAMWPKLLKASAVEAVLLKGERPSGAVAVAAVDDFLRGADTGTETRINVDPRITLVRRENERQITMESRDRQGWIHRSVIKK